jgi:hypothetical protein
MKIRMITALMSFALLCPFYVVASDFEDESSPIEQDYVKPIDQLNDDSVSSAFEAGPAPIEQGYVKSLEQIDDESMSSSFGGEPIPIE